MLDWLERISNVRIFSQNNSLIFNFRMYEKTDNPFHTLLDFWDGTPTVEMPAFIKPSLKMTSIPSKAVQMGALINANDHFGHSLCTTPLTREMKGLWISFRNGGDPNARSKHLSTLTQCLGKTSARKSPLRMEPM